MQNFNHPSKYGKMIVSFILIAIIYVLAFYSLWNWLMPKIFGLQVLSIWEAIGLLFLFKLIFGFHIGKNHSSSHCNQGWKRHLKMKMEGMSEEEKDLFKKKFEDRCSK